MTASLLDRVDHVVYVVSDLDAGIDHVHRLLGVRAARGGAHPDWGTHNAVLALGPASYLEIIAPDPEQPGVRGPRVFGVSEDVQPHLSRWAAKASDLESQIAKARRAGFDPGDVLEGARRNVDGSLLAWRLTDPMNVGSGGLRPFLIDWTGSAHPAASAPQGCMLVGLRAEHPEPEGVRRELEALGLALAVERAERARLVATIRTLQGDRLELS